MTRRDPVLIEQTQKKYKGLQLIGGLGCAAAVVLGLSTGAAVFVWLGFAMLGVLLSGAALAWWHHG